MGSGKYGAVSGLIGRMQMMDNISNHLSAVRTTAYKKGKMTFEAQLGEANSGMATKAVNYTRITKEEIDFTPGQLDYSGSPLHLGINGDGFFQVLREDGSIVYTRSGNFQLNTLGEMVNSEGEQVLSSEGEPIILPHPEVRIGSDGAIMAGEALIGTIGLYKFADNSVLKRAGTGMYVPTNNIEPEIHPEPAILQKSLESSNVDMMKTVARMTANMRTFDATQKALKIYGDMDKKAVELGLLQ